MSAALAAARSGARTLLVTDRPVPGGNSSSEIRVWTRGATGGGNLFAEEMGIWGELKLRALSRDPLGSVLTWDDVLLDALLEQEGLTLLLNTQMTAASVENERIERVSLRGLRTESEQEAQARVFVDCTGDGYLSKLAGVPFRTGREGREEFGESLALSAPDQFTQGCSILLQSRRLDHPAPYAPPDYAYPLERVRQLVDRGGRVVRADMQGSDCWWFEYGGRLDVIAEDQRIGLELRAIALGIWNYIKNSGRYDAENLQLEWLGLYPGRRGSRRLVGEETLTQRDVTGGLGRPGAVAYGGWYMDSHRSGGVLSEKEQYRQLSLSCYGLSLGCLYNPCVGNLLFAGRCASMSYAAYTSARVMNTCALMGQATGTAAAMCAARGMAPEALARTAQEALRRRLALDDALLWAHVEDGFLQAGCIIATSVRRPVAAPDGSRWPLSEQTFVVYPACGGQLRQIPAVLVQDPGVCPANGAAGGAGLGAVVGAGIAEDRHYLRVDVVQVGPGLPEGCGPAAVVLAQYAQQQVLGADIALLQLPCLLGRLFHRLPGPGGEPLLRPAGTAGAVGTLDYMPQPGLVQALTLEHSGPQAVPLHHYPQQQVLRTHIALAQFSGRQAGVLNGQLRPLSELLIAFYKAYPLGSKHI